MTRVLLVEDSPSDAELTTEVLRATGLADGLRVATDATTALELLRAGPPEQRPQLVLLDLDLPDRHGSFLLREAKRDPALRDVAVIILTSSEARDDVANSWDGDADGYIVKPVTAQQLQVALAIVAKRGVRAPSSG